MNDYAFGNFVYMLRTEKGLSQSQLGELLGVTNKAVSKWENGSAKPNTVLIPKIAEILGVTVEELFACKRFEKDSEFENIKNYLSVQKKKYAILSSVFLSLMATLPLLLIEFICIVMGFGLSDDIAGPLGSVGFIFVFIISITAFTIYRKTFIQSITPSEHKYASRFIDLIKNGLLVTIVAWWLLLALLFSVYLPMLSFSPNFIPANIFLSIVVFVLIILFGTIICFANVKRLLKIKFSTNEKERKRVRFSELPLWAKICSVATIVLFPFTFIFIQIVSILNNGWALIRGMSMILWYALALPVVIYNIKKK